MYESVYVRVESKAYQNELFYVNLYYYNNSIKNIKNIHCA